MRHSEPSTNPATQLRSLIQDGLITVAALDAADDLTAAAASVHRLGALTSGMWRAFGRELASAAERLDRQAQEHLDELQRRAHRLGVDPDAVMAAAVAMAHLEEHRETLGTLLPSLDDEVRRLAASDVLLGFTVDAEAVVENENENENEEDSPDETTQVAAAADMDATDVPRLAVRIWLFLWPAPLLPAAVTIVPDLDRLARSSTITDLGDAISVEVETPDALVDALAGACDLPIEGVLAALPRLGLACWSAHQADERGDDEDDQDDEDDDENEDDE